MRATGGVSLRRNACQARLMRVYLGSDHAGHELKKYRVRHFLNSPFSDEPRHRQRIAMLVRYENSGQRPPMPGR